MTLNPDWVEAVGTWAGAVGSFAAVGYAIVSVRREAGFRRQDIERLAEDQRRERDAQARTRSHRGR